MNETGFNKFERKSLSPCNNNNSNNSYNSNSNSNSSSNKNFDRKSIGNSNSNNSYSNSNSSSTTNRSQSSLHRLNDRRQSPSVSRLRDNSTDSELDNREVQKYLRKSENTERSVIPCFDSKRSSPLETEIKDYSVSLKTTVSTHSRGRGRERGRGPRDAVTAENQIQFHRNSLAVEGVSVKLSTYSKAGDASRSVLYSTRRSRGSKSSMHSVESVSREVYGIDDVDEIDTASDSGEESSRECVDNYKHNNKHDVNHDDNRYKNNNKNNNISEIENSVEQSGSQSQVGVREVTVSCANKIAAAWCDYITSTSMNRNNLSSLKDGNQLMKRRESGQCEDEEEEEEDDICEDGMTDDGIECGVRDRERIRTKTEEKEEGREEGKGDDNRGREGCIGCVGDNNRNAESTLPLAMSYSDISKLATEMIVVPRERIIAALEVNCSDSKRTHAHAPHTLNSNTNSNSSSNRAHTHAFQSDDRTVSEVIARIASMDEVENNTTLLRNAFIEVVRSMQDGVHRGSVEGITVDPVKPVKVNPFDLITDVIDSNFESLNNSMECSAANSTHTTRRPSLSEAGLLLHYGIADTHGRVAESKFNNPIGRKYSYDDSAKSDCNEVSGEYEEEFESEVENEVEGEVENERNTKGKNNYSILDSRTMCAMLHNFQDDGRETVKGEGREERKEDKGGDIEEEKEVSEEEDEDEYNSDFEDEKSV